MDTLDPKKKKIYIGVIAFCLLMTGGVLMYGFGGGGGSGIAVDTPAPGPGLTPTPTPTPGAGPSAGGGTHAAGVVPQVTTKTAYPAPSVVPAEPQFDLSIYDSGALTELADYVPLTVNESEVGRENPFLGY